MSDHRVLQANGLRRHMNHKAMSVTIIKRRDAAVGTIERLWVPKLRVSIGSTGNDLLIPALAPSRQNRIESDLSR